MDFKTLLEAFLKKPGSPLLRKDFMQCSNAHSHHRPGLLAVCNVLVVHTESLMGKSLRFAVEKNKGQQKEHLVWCLFTNTEKALYSKGSGAAHYVN